MQRKSGMVVATAGVVVFLLTFAPGILPAWAGASLGTVETTTDLAHSGNPYTLSLLPKFAVMPPAGTLALTPPMGWNGYNRFHLNVNAARVEAAARALVTSGMKAAGYMYVNLDGGWDLRRRGPGGVVLPDPAKFPRGIVPVIDYVHSLGLKFGIYMSAGTMNCAGTSAGSYGHFQQDAATFAAWGVDYLKLDWCDIPFQNYPRMTHPQVSLMLARQMGSALAATGRPIVYDVNDWGGTDEPWMWARPANLWRTTPDIQDRYSSMLVNFTRNVNHFARAGRSGWNDPDMLEVGNGGMSLTEYQSQFSLWAEMAAPLIAGNDLNAMSDGTRRVLTNLAVIAVDQDPLARQGYPVASAGGLWVLTKPLANGDRAVVFFNQTDTQATISATPAQVGLAGTLDYTLLDLWNGTQADTAGPIAATVPAHGVVFYRIARSATRPFIT
jgi:alpha-galactosidase